MQVQRRMLLLSAVLALAALCTVSGAALARDTSGTVTNGCVAGVPILGPSPSFSVTLSKHQCYKAGRTIPTGVSYTYKQLDYGGSVCGSTVNNHGPGFTPRLNTTYYVQVKFTVAPLKSGTGVKPRSTGWRQLVMGRWQIQCGQLTSQDPQASDVCDRVYPTGECNYSVDDPSYANTPLPRFAGKPLRIGDAVYSPKLYIPGGTCREKVIFRNARLMGMPNPVAAWSCPNDMLVTTELLIYYYPPGSSSVCLGDRVPAQFGYTVGPVNTLPDERFTRVKLPSDSSSWGGTAVFVFVEEVHPNNGTLQRNGRPVTIAHQYSNLSVNFSGSFDACSEISSWQI